MAGYLRADLWHSDNVVKEVGVSLGPSFECCGYSVAMVKTLTQPTP